MKSLSSVFIVKKLMIELFADDREQDCDIRIFSKTALHPSSSELSNTKIIKIFIVGQG